MGAERARRVLMTADTVGGVWHYALELARSLGDAGVSVALATMGDAPGANQRAQARDVLNVTLFESTYRLEWMPEAWDEVGRAGAWLLALERELAPDVVHLNQFSFGELPFGAPKLVVAHSCVLSWWRAVNGRDAPPEWDRYRAAVRRGLAGASLVVAPTRAMLDTLAGNYGYRGRGVVISNARDPARYRPGAKAPAVLAAGRVWDAAKNVAALEAIAAEIPWPIRVAGATAVPGGGVRELHGVQALGELGHDALARELATAAIYAHPARYEPFGLSALEAALCGCALVLGDIASLREVWGGAALFVAPDDHVALRDALRRLIADRALRERLARAARERALQYTPRRKADAYLSAYDAIVDGACRAPERLSRLQTEGRACAS